MLNPHTSDHMRKVMERSHGSPEFQQLKSQMQQPGFQRWAATSGRDATRAPNDPAGAMAHMRDRLAQFQRETGGNSPEADRSRRAAQYANYEAQRHGPPAPRGKRTFLAAEDKPDLRDTPTAPSVRGPAVAKPGAAQPAQDPYATSTRYDPQAAQQPYGAWSQQPQAPTPQAQPFQAQTLNFDGTQSQMPNFQQRDAFISQINNQLGQMQQQSWQQPGMGAPQFNFPQMWGQAGQMAEQGWQNPFAFRPPQG
jgi:hypothetical protein